MKMMTALTLAGLAGVVTFEVQNLAPQAQASGLPITSRPRLASVDDRGSSSTLSVDQALANLTMNLNLTADQVARISPILQAHHDRIFAILTSAPASLTHDEFSAQTDDQVTARSTSKQLELAKTLGTPATLTPSGNCCSDQRRGPDECRQQ